MKRTVSLLLTLAMALTVFAGCSAKQNAATPGVSVTTPLPGQPVSMDLSGQTFETALLKYVGAYKPDDNFAVSPLSFLFALGLLYEGCAGETKTEFEAALNSLGIDDLPGYLNRFNEFVSSVADTNKVLAEEYGQDVIKLEIANSVWKRDNIAEDFKEAYKNAIARYGAEYRPARGRPGPGTAGRLRHGGSGRHIDERALPEGLLVDGIFGRCPHQFYRF